MVVDKGLSIREVEDFISVCGDYVDIVKFGWGTTYVTPNIKEKINTYHLGGIPTYFGGILFEAFVVRDQFDDYRKILDNYNMSYAEVSDGSIELEHDVKCEYVRKLAEQVTVLSEVGSKDAEEIIPPYKWIQQMQAELDAGAWKVIGESRESGLDLTVPPEIPKETTECHKETSAAADLRDFTYVILGHVAAYPNGVHGYSLGRSLSRWPLRWASLRLGQLYRALRSLERAGLVDGHVESSSSRLRYRHVITALGRARLQEWLTHLPRETGVPCEQLLHRLRFADRIPGREVLRLIDETMTECNSNAEAIGRNRTGPIRDAGTSYEVALGARLAADQWWLKEIRRLLEYRLADG